MDELPTKLAALVNEARTAHDPRPEDARRIGAALSAAIPGFQASLVGGAAHGSAASAASGSVASGGTFAALGAAKWIGVAVVVAAAGAATTTLRTSSTQSAARGPSAAVVHAVSVPKPAKPAPVASTDAPVTSSADASENAGVPRPATPTHDSRPRREPVRRAAPAADVQPAATSTTSEELALIRAAMEAVRDHDPALARQLLQQHAIRFPEGALKQERAGMTLVVLCEAGKLDEARPMRDRFLAETPDSPLAARVKNACADPEP